MFSVFSVLLLFFCVLQSLAQGQINPPNCGRSRTTPLNRVINGSDAVDGEFPWLAVIQIRLRDGDILHGTGSVINSRWLLTAGHCCFSLRDEVYSFTALVGNVTRSGHDYTSDTKYPIVQRVILSDMSLSEIDWIPNDICLAQVEREMNLSHPLINAICLPDRPMSLNILTNYIFAGFGGLDENTQSNKAQVLRNNKIIAHDRCKSMADAIVRSSNRTYRRSVDETLLAFLTEKNFCRNSTPYQGICSGDSGGPMMLLRNDSWTLIGIATGSVKLSLTNFNRDYPCGFAQIFVNISAHLHWIESTLAGGSNYLLWLACFVALCLIIVGAFTYGRPVLEWFAKDKSKNEKTVSEDQSTTSNVSLKKDSTNQKSSEKTAVA